MSNPTIVNIHYHGPFNNYGQHSAGQGTINNINSPPTTDYLQSPSDQPETGIHCPHEVHQPEERESSPGTIICSACKVRSGDQPSACEIQSVDKPAELNCPPDSARNALPEVQQAEIKNSPETTIFPAPAYIPKMLRMDMLALWQYYRGADSDSPMTNSGTRYAASGISNTSITPSRRIHTSQADKPIADTTSANRTIPRNIVVFGQARSGKSSIINLLAGSSVANVAGGPANSTPSYYILHGDDNYTFWDTPGVDLAENGTSVSLGDDVHNLLNLVKHQGVSLLVYCIRGSVTDITRINYDFFWKIICVEKVPVVLVVTGLEGRINMDKWWQENIKTITKMKMVFAGHACITSWKGTRGIYEKEYKESADKVWKLVKEHSTPKPWHMTPRWSAQAQQIIVEYQKHFKARTMRKLLRDLASSL